MSSPRPPRTTAATTAVWGVVAVATATRVLLGGAPAQARLRDRRLAVERDAQERQERRLFWRSVAITVFVALVVTTRALAG